VLAVIIPPSILMIVWGGVLTVSIGGLFLAGIIPGLLIGLVQMATVHAYAKSRGYPTYPRAGIAEVLQGILVSIPALLTPAIIIGGMTFGLFTPTEAAIAACVWALFLGLVVYRTLDLRRLLRVSFDTIETTAVVLFIVAAASIFAWILTSSRITEQFAAVVLGATDSPWLVLLLMNLILLVVGCFLETIAAITILVPVFLPIIEKLGIDPVHFGVVMVLNLMIGLLTPPVGMVLYVLSRVSGLPFERCVAATTPFLIPLVLVLALITFIPSLTLWLPTLAYR
jgi:tripartite ATP-independent transporter DctM subunit